MLSNDILTRNAVLVSWSPTFVFWLFPQNGAFPIVFWTKGVADISGDFLEQNFWRFERMLFEPSVPL